jgi:hypothetical protein
MPFSTRNLQYIRFKLIDAGYRILRDTADLITWDGEAPPRSWGIEVVAA